MKNITLALLALIIATIISCGTSSVNLTPAPTTDESYTDLPFKKIINPAFTDEVVGKWARCKVRFLKVNDAYMARLLPSKYRKDYVGFTVSDIDNSTSMSFNVVIPKSNSDSVFDLTGGEIIELFVYIEEIKLPLGRPAILLRVEKLIKSN